MNKTLKIIVSGIIMIYVLMTLLYNSPNNYLKIKLNEELEIFDLFFNQKWGFFAPPPTFNNRLYFTFLDDQKKEIATFEILSELSQKKKKSRPFNEREEMLDYIINGSIISISNQIVMIRDIEKSKHPNFNIEKLNSVAIKKLTNNSQIVSGYDILKNYAKIVANNNLADKKQKSAEFVIIKINSIPIKKFTERYETKLNTENNIITFNPIHL